VCYNCEEMRRVLSFLLKRDVRKLIYVCVYVCVCVLVEQNKKP